MTHSPDTIEIIHVSDDPPLRVSLLPPVEPPGLHALRFAGSMCTTSVPGATEAIKRWLGQAVPARLGVDLGEVVFIDARGVSLLVAIQLQARALGVDWSIIDAGERVRAVLEVCDLLEPMGVHPVTL